MPITSSAEPDRIFRFVGAAADLDLGLNTEVAPLGAALDRVQRSCRDYCGPFPRLDHDLADLVHTSDQLVGRFMEVALRFLAADRGTVWVGRSPPVPFGPSFRASWALRDPSGSASVLAALGAARQTPAGDQPTSTDDLHALGNALLGIGQSVKSAGDHFTQMFSGPLSILSLSQDDRLTRQLEMAPPLRRVLGGLSRFTGTPLAGAAQSGLITLTLLEDANRLRRDGNPINAWRRKGVGYLADIAGAGFDVSSNACASEPNLVTCGAAAITGTAWAAAEIWTHRAEIGRDAELAARVVADEVRRVRDSASDALEATGRAQQDLIDGIRNPDRSPGLIRLPPVVTHAIADTVEHVGHAARAVVSGAEHVVSSGWDLLAH